MENTKRLTAGGRASKSPAPGGAPKTSRSKGQLPQRPRHAPVVDAEPSGYPETEATSRELSILLEERTATAREAIERTAAAEAERQAALNHMPLAFLAVNRSWKIVSANDAARRMWGGDAREIVGMDFWASYGRTLSEGGIHRRLQEAFNESKPVSFQTFSPLIGRWLDVHARLANDRLFIYARDVTSERTNFEVLTTLWRESRILTDNAPDPILRFNAQLRCTYVNKAASKMLGRTETSIIGDGIDELGFSPDSARRLAEAVTRTLDTGATQSAEISLDTRKGKKTLSLRTAIETGARRNINSVLIIARDITERKTEEQERGRLAAAIEQTAEGVIILGADGVVTYVNPAFCAITGYRKEELLKENINSFVQGLKPRIAADIEKAIGRGRAWSGRFQAKNKAGALRQWDVRVSPVKGPSRAVTGIVTILRDITAELEMEAQVREAQRLEAIGTLSGGIAHDFNNILAIILGNAELAIDDVGEGSPVRQNLNQLITASIRGRDLIRQILAFARKSSHHMQVAGLAPLVRETARLLRSTLPAFIELKLDIRTERDAVAADIGQMQQVLMNLATNASQSMPAGGVLTIGLHEIDLKQAPALPDAALKAGRHLVLSVSDTGKGMIEAVKQRIFEPFFTTKGQGEGTGLGLSVVYGIVKAHKGAITVKSAPGKGSTFRIFLPLVQEMPQGAGEGVRRPLPAGKGRVLFVDDEDAIAQMAYEMLSRLGYEVTTQTDAENALQVFLRNPGAFDVLVTDQTMPRMTGLNLARSVLNRRPDLPVILCTGYSETVDEGVAKAAGIKAFLIKPLTRQELARTLARVLKETAGPKP